MKILTKTYSTRQAAKLVGIHWVTLHRWLASKKVRPSQATPMNGSTLWRWTDADVEKLKNYKRKNYRKGRGRKPKPKR
jgi:predicted site-specific integrase-resolvase